MDDPKSNGSGATGSGSGSGTSGSTGNGILRRTSAADPADEREEQLRASHKLIGAATYGLNDADTLVVLRKKLEPAANTAGGPNEARDVYQSLVWTCLTDPAQAPRTFRTVLAGVVRDGFETVVTTLLKLVEDKWTRMLPLVRTQLLWLLDELLLHRTGAGAQSGAATATGSTTAAPAGGYVKRCDALCAMLLRQIPGGAGAVPPSATGPTAPAAALGSEARALAQEMVTLLTRHKLWLYAHPALVQACVYHFVRLVADHAPSTLRNDELAFLNALLAERAPREWVPIGRDLVRVLNELPRTTDVLPAFWKLLRGPPAPDASPPPSHASHAAGLEPLPPSTTLLEQILAVPTPPVFLRSRLTPEMESQLTFVMTQVKMGNQRRYQTHFVSRFLSATESGSLAADVIRFICACYHPPNHVIASDVVHRWAMLGWLVKTVRAPHHTAAAKLAIAFDVLYHDPYHTSLMNNEPLLLLLLHSIPKYADITQSMIEALNAHVEPLAASNLSLRARVVTGVENAFRTLVMRGVIRSLDPIFASPHVHAKVLDKFRATFPRLFSGPLTAPAAVLAGAVTPLGASAVSASAGPASASPTAVGAVTKSPAGATAYSGSSSAASASASSAPVGSGSSAYPAPHSPAATEKLSSGFKRPGTAQGKSILLSSPSTSPSTPTKHLPSLDRHNNNAAGDDSRPSDAAIAAAAARGAKRKAELLGTSSPQQHAQSQSAPLFLDASSASRSPKSAIDVDLNALLGIGSASASGSASAASAGPATPVSPTSADAAWRANKKARTPQLQGGVVSSASYSPPSIATAAPASSSPTSPTAFSLAASSSNGDGMDDGPTATTGDSSSPSTASASRRLKKPRSRQKVENELKTLVSECNALVQELQRELQRADSTAPSTDPKAGAATDREVTALRALLAAANRLFANRPPFDAVQTLANELVYTLEAEFSIGPNAATAAGRSSGSSSALLAALFEWAEERDVAKPQKLRADLLCLMAQTEPSLGYCLLEYCLLTARHTPTKPSAAATPRQTGAPSPTAAAATTPSSAAGNLYIRFSRALPNVSSSAAGASASASGSATATTTAAPAASGAVVVGDERKQLVLDLEICRDRRFDLFGALCHELYASGSGARAPNAVAALSAECVPLFQLVVETLNPAQVLELVHRIADGECTLFTATGSSAVKYASAALRWPAYEQSIVWQLLATEFGRSAVQRAGIASFVQLFLPQLSSALANPSASTSATAAPAGGANGNGDAQPEGTDQSASVLGLTNLLTLRATGGGATKPSTSLEAKVAPALLELPFGAAPGLDRFVASTLAQWALTTAPAVVLDVVEQAFGAAHVAFADGGGGGGNMAVLARLSHALGVLARVRFATADVSAAAAGAPLDFLEALRGSASVERTTKWLLSDAAIAADRFDRAYRDRHHELLRWIEQLRTKPLGRARPSNSRTTPNASPTTSPKAVGGGGSTTHGRTGVAAAAAALLEAKALSKRAAETAPAPRFRAPVPTTVAADSGSDSDDAATSDTDAMADDKKPARSNARGSAPAGPRSRDAKPTSGSAKTAAAVSSRSRRAARRATATEDATAADNSGDDDAASDSGSDVDAPPTKSAKSSADKPKPPASPVSPVAPKPSARPTAPPGAAAAAARAKATPPKSPASKPTTAAAALSVPALDEAAWANLTK